MPGRQLAVRVASLCVIATPLASLFWLSGTVSLPAAFGAMVLTTAVVLVIGCALLRALGVLNSSPAAAWVIGVFATSLALYVLAQSLSVPVMIAAAMVSVAAAVLAWWQRLWRTPVDEREVIGLALCGAVTLVWCHYSASAPATLARFGVLPVWVDYVIDGTVISSFGDPLAQGAQSIELAGFARPFYHYASYLLPAVFAEPFDLPGLPLATSVWLPLGFFTMCAGAYTFGAALSGPLGGLAAVAALTLLPDASTYGLENALFGFNWQVLIRPSAACAVGVALVSFVLLQRWCEERRPELLIASIVAASGLVLFRAQLSVLAVPCVLATAAVATAHFRHRWAAYIAAGVIVLAAFLAISSPETRALPAFLLSVHEQPGIAYAGWYDSVLSRYGLRVAAPLGMLLVFLAFLGAFAVLYPFALRLPRRTAFDAMPLLLMAGYAVLMLIAPVPANGDPTELTQRPFVLVYAVVAAWTAAVLAVRIPFECLVAVSAAAVVALWPDHGFSREGPRVTWGWNYHARAFTPGLTEAAAFFRAQAKPGDVFAVHGLPRGWAPVERPGWVPVDAAVELTALSGMPAYIARPYLPILEGGERRLVAQERLEALEAIEHEMRRDIALGRLAAYGVRWYVATSNQAPRWDPGHQLAAFRHGEVAVYRTTSR